MKQHRFDKEYIAIIEAVSDVYEDKDMGYWVEYKMVNTVGKLVKGKEYGSHVDADDEKNTPKAFEKLMISSGLKLKDYKIIKITDKASDEYKNKLK